MPYARAINELKEELARDQDAVRVKEALLHGLEQLQARRIASRPPKPQREPAKSRANVEAPHESLNLAVLSVLRAAACPMSTKEIHGEVSQTGYVFGGKFPRQRISKVLEQLVHSGSVRRAATGRGRSPNMYSVV